MDITGMVPKREFVNIVRDVRSVRRNSSEGRLPRSDFVFRFKDVI